MTAVNAKYAPTNGNSEAEQRVVLVADLVSYSRHVAQDEAATLAFMDSCFNDFERLSADHAGRIVKTMGDGILALFDTAGAAVAFALEFQARVAAQTDVFVFRIGINLGDVELRHGDVFGHVVNVAARLESLCDPGGLCISRVVFDALDDAVRRDFTTLGPQRLYNLPGTYEPFQFTRQDRAPGRGASPDALHLTVIGKLALRDRGRDINLPRTADGRVLLAYLSMAPNQSEALGRLGAVLRPDASAEAARAVVEAALEDLEGTIGSALDRRGDVASIRRDHLHTDVERIIRNAACGYLEDGLVAPGDWVQTILSGLEGGNSAVTAWLALMRSDVREQAVSVLETEMWRIEDDGDPALRRIARAILNIEPCHEGAARRLMIGLRSTGNLPGAVRILDQLTRNLSSRFGLEPRPETRAAALGESRGARSLRDDTTPLRIQVLGFEGPSDAATARLSSFRSEIIAGLSRFRSWSVVEGEQGALQDTRTDYILNGVQRQEGGFVTLTLSAADTGRVVWSEDLDISVEGLASSRLQAVGRIAAIFELYVSTDRAATPDQGANHMVVDNWLRGERLLTRWSKQAFEEAITLFEDLIARAPEFAPAHASLASALNVLHVVRPGMRRDPAMGRRALEASNIAVGLDPLDARNRLALAWSSALKDNFDRAALNMDMAERLNPNSPRTLASCAMGFSFLGEHERALRVLEHCLDCAPVLLDYQWCYAASIRFLAGDDAGALQAALRSDDRIIDNPGWTAAALARLGRLDEAQASFARLVEDVTAVWDGDKPPTREDVRNWFVSAYPIWQDTERHALSDALGLAMGDDT